MAYLLPFIFLPLFMRLLKKWIVLSRLKGKSLTRLTITYIGLCLFFIWALQIYTTYSTEEMLLVEVFVIALVSLGVIDGITGYLPDQLTLPLIGIGMMVNLLGKSFLSFQHLNDPIGSLFGAVIGYGIFYIANQIYLKIKGCDGLGMGDAKLLSAIGAWFGPINLIMVIGIASALSLAIPLVCLVFKLKRGYELPFPFGPYLAMGGFICLLKLPLQI